MDAFFIRDNTIASTGQLLPLYTIDHSFSSRPDDTLMRLDQGYFGEQLAFEHCSKYGNEMYFDKIVVNATWNGTNTKEYPEQYRKSFKIDGGSKCLGLVNINYYMGIRQFDVEPSSSYESYFLLEWPDRTLSQVKVDWTNGKYHEFKMVKPTFDGYISGAATSDFNGFLVFGQRSRILGEEIGFTVGFVENLNVYRDEAFFEEAGVVVESEFETIPLQGALYLSQDSTSLSYSTAQDTMATRSLSSSKNLTSKN